MQRKIACLLLFLSAAVLQDAGYAQKSKAPELEPWQGSWEKFVDAHNSCIKNPDCDRKAFLNKEVRWVGLVLSIDLQKQPPSIVMDMPGPPPLDKNGVSIDKARDLYVFVLNPKPPEIATWKTVAKGQRIRFRAITSGGITGSVISFSSIPGHKMLMVNMDGGEFIEQLPVETKQGQ